MGGSIMGNAGRVLMIPKGDYNAATTYEMLDCVYYNGRSYVCKQTSTGNVPTNTTYWQVMTPDSSAEIQALTNYVAENNVKNLLPVSLSALKSLNAGGSWNGNVCTIGGITFTVNDDLSITLNETSTATVTFTLYNGTNPTDYNGKILSGFTGGSGGTGIRISDTIATSVYNYSDDTLITGLTATNQVAVIIRIDSGKTFTNQLITPMIRDASITDASYQPYAKTNVELTQDASWLTSAKTYYDANTDPTVKQNHYNVAKYFYDFIKPGESHTVIIRYAGGYYDTMILSRDNGTGLFCVDFCHADGLGKILYFRYNGTSDTFTDLFSVT